MRYALAIVLLALISCQKVDLSETDLETEEQSSTSISVTGDAFNVGPVSADILIYANTAEPLFLDETSQNTTSVQYCTDRLFANGKEVFPIFDEITDPKHSNQYTCRINQLEPNTTYFYRSHVRLGDAHRYGKIRSFKTEPLRLQESGFVDLGLSVKWSATNFGANLPTGIGNRYSQSEALSLETDGFRIPSASDFEELCRECICAATVYNGTCGCMVTGKNGKSMFLPACPPIYADESDVGINPIQTSELFLAEYVTSTPGMMFCVVGSYDDRMSVVKIPSPCTIGLRVVQ